MRRIGAEIERVAPATVVVPVLEQPLLANRPALTAFLKRVRTNVRLTDWVGQAASDRRELVCRCTIREQALKMPLRIAGHVDATFSLTELCSPPDEKAGVEAGEGRNASGECGSAGRGAAATLTCIVRRRATSLRPRRGRRQRGRTWSLRFENDWQAGWQRRPLGD